MARACRDHRTRLLRARTGTLALRRAPLPKSVPLTPGQLNEIKAMTRNAADNPDKTKAVAEVWSRLAAFGDTYAKAAADGLSDPRSVYGQVIRNAWHQTGADFSKFGDVALRHLQNYVRTIDRKFNEDGIASLPTSTQIETSYAKAVEYAGVSPYTAVDLLLSRVTAGTSAPNWYDSAAGLGLGLEADRIGPRSKEAMALSPSEASAKLAGVTASTADTPLWQTRSAEAKTGLPFLKYASDALARNDAALTGASDISLNTPGGLKIYNNASSHVTAIFDKAGRGSAWIDGKWISISPGNWRLDPDQSEAARNSGTNSFGRRAPGEIYQFKDPASGAWKRADLPEATHKHAGAGRLQYQ